MLQHPIDTEEPKIEFSFCLSRELAEKLSRAGAILSRRYERRCTLEDVLEAMSEIFLQRLDPQRKAEPAKRPTVIREPAAVKPVRKPAAPVPSSLKIQALRRDRNQCTHVDTKRGRCRRKKRVDVFLGNRGGAVGACKMGGKKRSSSVELGHLGTFCAQHAPDRK